MKLLLVTLAVLFVCAAPAAANNGHHHHQTAIDPAFTCNGTTCTYVATGLAAGEHVSARFEYLAATGSGCDTGYGNANADATGTFTLTEDEVYLLACNDPLALSLPGTMTAWLATDSTPWDAPVIAGTLHTFPVS